MMKTTYILLLTWLGFASLQAQGTEIVLNQVGFYPHFPKIAVVIGDGSARTFHVVDASQCDTLFSAPLSILRKSANSSLQTRIADFSGFTSTGSFAIRAGDAISPVFVIANNVQEAVAQSSIKGFYYQRVSMPLEAPYAGIWHRPAGHPDTSVLVHPSAASASRPQGSPISSPGGWYDAGDYNKYIVNSGITMGTLLSAYEDFPSYFNLQTLNIPESHNQIPDILDEVLYNLRWMLTMQDPSDGGVYNKCTNANFDGMLMPHECTAPRYVVQKGTAASLNFAAVMAQAARVYKPWNRDQALPGLADSCLHAATKAWQWAVANPQMQYDQDEINKRYLPQIVTGGYGDKHFDDERFWAACELYATTNQAMYAQTLQKHYNAQCPIPSWADVGMLGTYTLLRVGKMQTLLPNAQKDLLQIADKFVASTSSSAFACPMGQSSKDFVWGSSAVAANQGILLINAYYITQDVKYLNASLSNADYLLGRNATTYCFLTGFGTKQVMNPHHRQSQADGIDAPIPGLLSGGPNPGMQDKCSYPRTEPETAFVDHVDSFASNEIAINWNAPAAYLLNALEVLCNDQGR